jgi:hypothetical protein
MDSRSASVSIAFGRKQEAAGPAWDDDDRTHHSNPGVVRVHGHEWLGVAVACHASYLSDQSHHPPARRRGTGQPSRELFLLVCLPRADARFPAGISTFMRFGLFTGVCIG